MYEMAKSARADMKAKAKRMATPNSGAIDASGWTEPTDMHAGAQTGMKPVSRRNYARGGKIAAMLGDDARPNAGRKPRASGGKAIIDDYMNRDEKEANRERPGVNHVGGYKRGGKADGGPTAGDLVPTQRFGFHPSTSKLAESAGMKKGGKAKKGGGGTLAMIGRGVLDPIGLVANKVGAPDPLGKLWGMGKDGGKDDDSGPSLATAPAPSKKAGGATSDEKQDKKLIKSMVKGSSIKKDKCGGGATYARGGGTSLDGEIQGMRPTGGRLAKKHGGEADAHWIKGAIKHPGALHKELHVPEGDKIPAKKLDKAEHSSNKLVAKRAHLAETLRGMNREGRAHGGRTKGKTTVNVIIGQPPQGQQAQPPMPMPPPPVPMPPRAMPPGPPPAGAGPMPMPPAGAPPMPPGMPRKSGGRTMAGAGSGPGRLQKTAMQKRVYP